MNDDRASDEPEDGGEFFGFDTPLAHAAAQRAVEAAVFASEKPMTPEQIRLYVGDDVDVLAILKVLQGEYEGRGITLVRRGQGWHFQTAADLSHMLRRERTDTRKLSRAATETLSIIAYHEPVSRAEIEAIRGVQTSKGTLDVLMEAGWVRPTGRREVPGRPLIYATTQEFLVHFGLASRRDLPGIDDLRAAGLLEPVDETMERFGQDDDMLTGPTLENADEAQDMLESGVQDA